MKKECEQTRRTLRRYLRGHVFTMERKRIERHLKTCPLCATEYQSLKRSDETTQFLKDITPVEGVVQKVRTGVSGLSRVRKILYRPLWALAVVAAVFLLTQYVIRPYLRDREREWSELTSPAAPGAARPIAPVPAGAARSPEAKSAEPPQALSPREKNADPLVITIAVDDEQAAIRRINDVMRGHGELRAKRFSDSVREISGELTPKELLTFISRIESAGKISYSRSRFEQFPSAQPLPFLMKLKAAPKPKPSVNAAETPARPAIEAAPPRASDKFPAQADAPAAPKPAPESPQAR